MAAAVTAVALAVPQAAHFIGQCCGLRTLGGLLQAVHIHRVAAHLAVVAHAVVGVQFGKAGPITALAQQQQPVVAQAVFLVGTGPAGQKGLHFIGLGLVQAGAQLPVSGPGLQGVAARGGQQLAQALALAFAKGLLHLQQGVVSAVLCLHGRREGCQHRGCEQRCQNLCPLHGGIMRWTKQPCAAPW